MSISSQNGPTYSRLFGFVFLFNLILGTGALALPKAFQQAGWLLGGIIIILVAVMSFIPATFIFESMAIANALKLHNTKTKIELENDESSDEVINSSPNFEVVHKFELGEIVSKVAGKTWTALFYANISIYLYGDLTVYAAAVPKSLRDLTCNSSVGENETLHEFGPCWAPDGMTRMNVYRIYLTFFALLLGPFFFFNVTKTRWLQIGTSAFRWIAIILMVSLACVRISQFSSHLHLSPSPIPHPRMADFSNLASLFGVAVYAFMCHHSLPGVLTPVVNKHHIYSALMLPAYCIILLCYLLLAGTAVAAFKEIQDLYTLNFVPSSNPDSHPGALLLVLDYFLALYPVMALSSTFPIVGTTLSNNLIALFRLIPSRSTAYHSLDPLHRTDRCETAIRYGVPFLVLLPPIFLAMVTNDIELLVGITGAFGGSGIQYLFPVVIVYYARNALAEHLRQLTSDQSTTCVVEVNEDSPLIDLHCVENPYRSPFSHRAWCWLVIVWAIVCVSIVFLHKVHAF